MPHCFFLFDFFFTGLSHSSPSSTRCFHSGSNSGEGETTKIIRMHSRVRAIGAIGAIGEENTLCADGILAKKTRLC